MANLALRDVLGQPDDDAVLHQADEETAAGVSGWETEHAADSQAAVVLDEFREEWLKISSKRDGHRTTDCKAKLCSYCFSF